MKYLSSLSSKVALLLYLISIISAIFLFTPSNLSTNLLSIFPKTEDIKRLEDISKFSSLNQLMVLSSGFDEKAKKELQEISTALKKSPYIGTIYLERSTLDKDTQSYLNRHYLDRVTIKEINSLHVKESLESLYKKMSSSFIFTPIDTNDPFALINDPLLMSQSSLKDGYAFVKEKGLLLRAEVNFEMSDLTKAKAFYDEMALLSKKHPSSLFYAPHFFSAENSTKIKSEINFIIGCTVFLLLFFYIIALRDIKTLLLTSLALASSVFVSLSFTTALFSEVSVFTLAFGSGIAMMSVDYFFHYYFLGYYDGNKSLVSKVFFAFLTTSIGLFLMTFATFDLISQLAFFGMVSLTFSFLIFTFLFADISMKPKKKRLNLHVKSIGFFHPILIAFVSLAVIFFSLSKIEIDTVLQHLDYQNIALKEKQAIFKKESDKKAVLIYADTLDELFIKAANAKEKASTFTSLYMIQKDIHSIQDNYTTAKKLAELNPLIQTTASEIGFRKEYFKETYLFESIKAEHNLSVINTLGFETKKIGKNWISLAFVEEIDVEKIRKSDGIFIIEASEMLKKSLSEVIEQLLFLALFTLLVIFIIITIKFKKESLRTINYTLFPLALILLFVANTTTFSVMHMFALIIVIVAALDYGIYMSSPEKNSDEAILYAMITSFAGFGIFIFSSIGALNHIGSVITLGIVATFFLQIFQTRVHYE